MEPTNSVVDENEKTISQRCFREDMEQLVHNPIPPLATCGRRSEPNNGDAPSISVSSTVY